jgi:cardiolipin synthase
MDRRSFDLNYETNILFHDLALSADVRRRPQSYIERSRRVAGEDVDQPNWCAFRRT